MKYISVGQSGVWAVDHDDKVYYRNGTYNDNGSKGTGWQQVCYVEKASFSYCSKNF